MPLQDRSGTKYEKLLAASLLFMGYELNGTGSKNYLHPGKRSDIIIPHTFIQPDLVVRSGKKVKAVIYSTHWSETRSSKKKFWRTWEEAAQQKVILGSDFLTVNCIFEALPEGTNPIVCIHSEDLPKDKSRQGTPPIQLNGWDPGIGWAMVEAFDVSIVFPVGYPPVHLVNSFDVGDHDLVTTKMVKAALKKNHKKHYSELWQTLRNLRDKQVENMPNLNLTQSRYRIGLIHVYLFYRLFQKISGNKFSSFENFISSIVENYRGRLKLDKILKSQAFSSFSFESLRSAFWVLSMVPVRTGTNPVMFCSISQIKTLIRITFNKDLELCLEDLKQHLSDPSLFQAIYRAFNRFDACYGVNEALEDLAKVSLVLQKESFVRKVFGSHVGNMQEMDFLLQSHAKTMSSQRRTISSHSQNWVFEMLLYLTGLNSSEDIQKRFKEVFESSGHKLRPHAPYGGHAQTVAFMLQGRDVCEQWSTSNAKRTLSPEEFRRLCWESVAQSLVEAFKDRGGQIKDPDTVITKYLENKALRIISSDLNSFHIMVDFFLGDLCTFAFDDEPDEAVELGARIRPSWQTEVINGIWSGRPLETWLEGVSNDGKWLIKVQSAQDGNEGHKTKELSGRCRGMRVAWSLKGSIQERAKWQFRLRSLPKLALVLDGDWSSTRKRNLYEAGWDWVGDVSQLTELRKLIMES